MRQRRVPVERVGVQVDVAGVAGLRVVLGVGGIPLDDQLVFAVAVEVAHARVVGAVRVRLARGGHAAGRDLQGNAQVGLDGRARGQDERRARRLLQAEHDGTDEIGVRLGEVGRAVHVVRGTGQRCRVEAHGRAAAGRAIEVEGHVGRIRAQHAPADEDLGGAGADGDDTPSEVLEERGLRAQRRRREQEEDGQRKEVALHALFTVSSRHACVKLGGRARAVFSTAKRRRRTREVRSRSTA